MKPSRVKMPALAVVAATTLVAMSVTGAGCSFSGNAPDTAGEQSPSSSAASQSGADSVKNNNSANEAFEAINEENRKRRWIEVKSSLEDNWALGGWWRAEEADERFVFLDFDSYSQDLRLRVYSPDSAAQYGYSLAGENTISSMEPLFDLVVDDPFAYAETDETMFTLSDGTRYIWRKSNLDTLALASDATPCDLFASNLTKIESASVPASLKMAITRADYDEKSWQIPLADIVDATYINNLQVLSGTIRIASFGELWNEKMHVETAAPDTDGESYWSEQVVELVLDSPTFVEGEDISSLDLTIEPVRTIGLAGNEVEWLSMDGHRVVIAVSAENVSYPSDVEPCDAWASDVELW